MGLALGIGTHSYNIDSSRMHFSFLNIVSYPWVVRPLIYLSVKRGNTKPNVTPERNFNRSWLKSLNFTAKV